MSSWQNKIVAHADVDPHELTAHALNWRRHPQAQRDALVGAIAEVGFIRSVTVNWRTGHIIDGHLRVEEAIQSGQPTIPVEYVDLTEDEEREALATIDPLAAMAEADSERLDALLREVSSADAAVMQMLAGLAERTALPEDETWADALGGLPAGDRAPFQQMTFTITDQQAEAIKAALSRAKDAGDFGDTGNENSNGNALARICEAYDG